MQVMKARRRVLRQERSSTLTSAANLASTLQNQGRWKEAEELDVQMMEASKTVLGQTSPGSPLLGAGLSQEASVAEHFNPVIYGLK
jgi:hypothetical protein